MKYFVVIDDSGRVLGVAKSKGKVNSLKSSLSRVVLDNFNEVAVNVKTYFDSLPTNPTEVVATFPASDDKFKEEVLTINPVIIY